MIADGLPHTDDGCKDGLICGQLMACHGLIDGSEWWFMSGSLMVRMMVNWWLIVVIVMLNHLFDGYSWSMVFDERGNRA